MKKKKCLILIGVILVALVVIAALLYRPFMQHRVLQQRMMELGKETYSFSADFEGEGITSPKVEKYLSQGNLTGTKGNKVVYGTLTSENIGTVDVYIDCDGNMEFNVQPMLEDIVNELEKMPLLSIFVPEITIDDIFLSPEQIYEITGEEIAPVKEKEELFKNICDQLSDEKIYKAVFFMKEKKDLAAEEQLLGSDAHYYEIELKDKKMTVLIGVPADETLTKVSFRIQQNETIWNVVISYELTGDVVETMPENTLDEEQINGIKKVYDFWKEMRNTK